MKYFVSSSRNIWLIVNFGQKKIGGKMNKSLSTSDVSLNSQNKDTKTTEINQSTDSVITIKTIKDEIVSSFNNQECKNVYSENLNKVLKTGENLKQIKSTDIKFSEPILKHGDNAFIFPHTINFIQGQAGVHKSRLAEYICSALLKLNGCQNELLGFKRSSFEATHTVVYVDTERNLKEQFPFAIQSILIKAGYDKSANPNNFKYISLLEISRKERYSTLNEYLNYIKKETDAPLFIVLDVSTDCIEDFNKTDKSMELIDLMNMTINEHNVVFLCLIHENPQSEKARGHFGSELKNKASTVIQVSFEKDSNQNDTDIIRVKYLKCRSTARHTSFHIKYCQIEKGLVLADSIDITNIVNSRKQKASNEDIIELLEINLGDNSKIQRRLLLDTLCEELKSKDRTIEARIKEIICFKSVILNNDGKECHLCKEKKEKIIYYSLIPIL